MSLKEIKILLVEDNPDHQLLAEMAFKRIDLNIHLKACENGEEAIELVEKELFNPDIVLLDVDLMNELNGFEIAEYLKKLPQFERTGIIYYTGYDNPEYKAMAEETGAFDYILKDYDMSVTVRQLKSVIERWLEGEPLESV